MAVNDYISFLNKARAEVESKTIKTGAIKVRNITAKQEQRIILERLSECFIYGFKTKSIIGS